ncbi:MAG: hypothetical protein KTR26_15375 [Flammeovirgaceae bacterium]|nr:hypothetical protein [Flammeovirgaceae bacterium]
MNFRIFFIILFLLPTFLFGQDQFNLKNHEWIKALDEKNKEALSAMYFDKAALFMDYQIILGKGAITQALSNKPVSITDLQSESIVPQDSNHIFQIGYYLENEEINYAFVTGWTFKDGAFLKEFEAIFSYTITKDKQNINLDPAREKWIKLANTNKPKKLLKGSYTKNAYYFHREKLSQGHTEISERYTYMAQPGYKITLSPDKIIQVQPNLALEVGEFKTNGSGRYILIWQKEKNGEWKALFDFNF